MFLKSLELSGFKSFAKKTTIRFEPGITAIVGPNGSGKSNVADAIRWVLGAQSKKAVRGKVSSDVIFSGSGTKAAMGLAEVALTFENSAKRLPYDYDEVVVTRRLYRSGDSEYLVNGNKVRLTDLHHAFAVAGIGAENYTVIGQGMVDRVLSQSARERRSLFEEAAGVRQFQIKRDEARRRLSETQTNLSRVEDIVKELEPRLRLLRRQAGALAKKEEIERELRDAYRARFGHEYRKLAGEYESVKTKRDDLDREHLAMQRELGELTTAVEDMRRSRQGLKLTDLLSKQGGLVATRERLQGELNEASTKKQVAQAALTRAGEQRDELNDRLKELEAHAPEAAAEPETDDDLDARQQAFDKLDAAYAQAKSALESGGSQAVSASLDSVERLVAEKKPHEQIAAALKDLRALIEGGEAPEHDIGDLLTKRDAASKELQQAQIARARVTEAAKVRQEHRDRYEREVAAIRRQLEQLREESQNAEKTIETMTGQLSSSSDALGAVNRQLKELEPQVAEERQSTMEESGDLDRKEEELKAKQRIFEAYRSELGELNITLAKLETRLDDLTREAKSRLGDAFPPATDEELPEAGLGDEQTIAKLERRQLELGAIDPEVSKEHQEVEERHGFLSGQTADSQAAKADLEKLIRQLERKSTTIFREAFTNIDREFGNYFTKLFGGGKAELKLVESRPEDEAEEGEEAAPEFGIDIRAVPPGKRVQNLSMLSGGERAMTSVALLFAILTVNPSPFVMLDEVDAALDEANTSRFADTLRELSEKTQFVVVTHNRDTMQAAETLYGVTMDETGISTLLSIKLPEAEKVAQAA